VESEEIVRAIKGKGKADAKKEDSSELEEEIEDSDQE